MGLIFVKSLQKADPMTQLSIVKVRPRDAISCTQLLSDSLIREFKCSLIVQKNRMTQITSSEPALRQTKQSNVEVCIPCTVLRLPLRGLISWESFIWGRGRGISTFAIVPSEA